MAVARQLTSEYGNSFSQKQLWRMIQCAETYPDEQIVVSLIRQLSWTHSVALIPLKDPLKRDFYAEMRRIERWSVRALRKKIDSMLYERTALSRKPEELGRAELEQLRAEDKLTPEMVLKDSYILDFLGLQDRYLEKDFEDTPPAPRGVWIECGHRSGGSDSIRRAASSPMVEEPGVD